MPMSATLSSALLNLQRRLSPTGRGSYALARSARQAVARDQWQGRFRTPFGAMMELDLATYPDVSMAYGVYELETVRLIRRILKPGMWFVDGGANVGYFSLLADSLVGPTGRVDAFEPDPFNRSRLEQHLRENNARVTRVHPFALAAMRTILKLYRPAEGNHGMSSVYSDHNSSDLSFEVETVRLDELLETVPHLIKLDIEGSELAAIEGASAILRSDHAPDLIIEHNPASAHAGRYAPGDIFNLLVSLQPAYRVYWIGWRLGRIENAGALNQIQRQGNIYVTASER